MRVKICIGIITTFVFSLECMNRSSQHSEKASHSPKRMLNEVLRRSDNCLKEFTRSRSKESSPLRSFQSIQNLDKERMPTALVLPDNNSPREQEASSSPKKIFTSILARSNSRKYLSNPKTSKESSAHESPRGPSVSDASIHTPDELDTQVLEAELCNDDLKRFFRKKMKKNIAKINAGKVEPLPANTGRTKSSFNYCGDFFAKHYLFIHEYKDVECKLHFIECSTTKKLLCFINCPLLYE